MLEAYFAAACVGLLLLLAFAVVTIDAQWKALKRAKAQIVTLADKLEYQVSVSRSLFEQLEQARKNDNRDASGRFAKANS